MQIAVGVLPQQICCLVRLKPNLEGPDVGALEPLERPADPLQPPLMVLEVEGLPGALEVDLDEEEALVVLAEDGLEEAAAADEVEQHEVVGGGQVVQVVLRRRRLRRPRDLVPHKSQPPLLPARAVAAGEGLRRSPARGFCFWGRVPRRGGEGRGRCVACGGGDR